MIYNSDPDAITVFLDYRTSREPRRFHCVRCGRIVCEITGDVKVLTPGYPNPEEQRELDIHSIIQCPGAIRVEGITSDERMKCGTKFIFT